MAAHVVQRFGGEVPSRLADLVTLAGVGRKTANVVRSVAFELPGLPVDTHVGACPGGSSSPSTPIQEVELELNGYLPPAERGRFSLRLIRQGGPCARPSRRAAGRVCWRTSAPRACCRPEGVGGRPARRPHPGRPGKRQPLRLANLMARRSVRSAMASERSAS